MNGMSSCNMMKTTNHKISCTPGPCTQEYWYKKSEMQLFCFPSVIFLQFLSEWLTIEDYCLLDSAVCNHSLRSSLANIVTNRFTISNTLNNKKAVTWLELRGICCSRVSLKSWCAKNTKNDENSSKSSKVTKCLTIEKQYEICDMELLSIINHLNCLTSLTILNGVSVTNSKVWNIVFKTLTNLNIFEVHNSHNFCDNNLLCIAKYCRNFEHLKLNDCPKVSNMGIIQFSKECNTVSSFTLHNVSSSTKIALLGITISCKARLRLLDIAGLTNVTNEVAKQIAVIKTLVHLNISDTAIDEVGVLYIINGCALLEHLNCSKNSDNVSTTTTGFNTRPSTSAEKPPFSYNPTSNYHQYHPGMPGRGRDWDSGGRGGCRYGGRDGDRRVVLGGVPSSAEQQRERAEQQSAIFTTQRTICAEIAATMPMNPHLTWLNISDRHMTAWGSEVNLGRMCPNITYLNIGRCLSTLEERLGLKELRQLTYLDISAAENSRTQRTNFNIIGANRQLKTIIANNYIGNDLCCLHSTITSAHCSVSITSLNLSMTYISRPEPPHYFPAIEYDGTSLSQLVMTCVNLTSLSIANTRIDDKTLDSIMNTAHFTKMKQLNLNGCNSLSDATLTNLVLRCNVSTTINHTKLQPICLHTQEQKLETRPPVPVNRKPILGFDSDSD